MAKTSAGMTRKSHKSRKTAPSKASAKGPSSRELATELPTPPPDTPAPLNNALVSAFAEDVAKATEKRVEEEAKVPEEVPAKQWWYRPADSKARKMADKIAVHRAAGRDDASIAKLLKTTEGTVRQYVYLARKNGWFDADDEPVDLEADLALTVDRKVVRNVSAALDGQMTNWQTHEMTIAAAKGRGIFKSHEKSESKTEALSVVAIRIEMPPLGADDQKVIDENIGGTPIYIDAEEVDDVRTGLVADGRDEVKALPSAS